MSKKITTEIKSCFECPFSEMIANDPDDYDHITYSYYCTKTKNKSIIANWKELKKYQQDMEQIPIPKWCPLENAETPESKPVTCPYCNKKIETLDNVQTVYVTCSMDRHGQYDTVEDIGDATGDYNVWQCPLCGHTIADNEEDAIAFLNGELEVKNEGTD